MAKKRTLICIHVMPFEIEMFEKLMIQFHKAFQYLDGNDDVTLKVTLNLNPELTDWQNSELRQGYFVSRFGILFNGMNISTFILLLSDIKKACFNDICIVPTNSVLNLSTTSITLPSN